MVGFLSYNILDLPQRPFKEANRMGHLHHIAILPAYQRQGFGTKLVEQMKSELVLKQITRWIVSYWCFNKASAALMARAGATPYQIYAEGHV